MIDKRTLDSYWYFRRHGVAPRWALRQAKAERRAWDLGMDVVWDWDDYLDDSLDDPKDPDTWCPDYRRYKAGYTNGRSREKWYLRKCGYSKQESRKARQGENRHYAYSYDRGPDCSHTCEYAVVRSPLSKEALASCGGFTDLDSSWNGDSRFYRRAAEAELLAEALAYYDKELRDCVYYLGEPIEKGA